MRENLSSSWGGDSFSLVHFVSLVISGTGLYLLCHYLLQLLECCFFCHISWDSAIFFIINYCEKFVVENNRKPDHGFKRIATVVSLNFHVSLRSVFLLYTNLVHLASPWPQSVFFTFIYAEYYINQPGSVTRFSQSHTLFPAFFLLRQKNSSNNICLRTVFFGPYNIKKEVPLL